MLTPIEFLVVLMILVILMVVIFASLIHSPDANRNPLQSTLEDTQTSAIKTLQSQVRELSCEVKGGVWAHTIYFDGRSYDICTKGGVEYTYEYSEWVNLQKRTLSGTILISPN